MSVCVRLRNYFSVHLCPFGCLSVCFVPFSYLWVNDSFFCFLCLSESVCAQFRHGILPHIYMYRQGEEGGGGGVVEPPPNILKLQVLVHALWHAIST